MGLGAFESERRVAGYFGGAQGRSYGRFGASNQRPKPPVKKLTLIDRLVAAITPSSWQKPKSLKGYTPLGWTPGPHPQIPHLPQQIPHLPQQHHPHPQHSTPGVWWDGAGWNYNPNADPNAYLWREQDPSYALGPIFRTFCCKSPTYDTEGNPILEGCDSKLSSGSCKNAGCNWVDCTGI